MRKRLIAPLALIALGAGSLAQAQAAAGKPPPSTRIIHAARTLAPHDLMKHQVTAVIRAAAAPANLTAAPAGPPTAAKLTWTNDPTFPAATDMYVERAADAAFTTNMATFTLGSGTATTYADPTVASGQTYYYRVRAENAVSYSAWSNITSLLVLLTPPAPINLVANANAIAVGDASPHVQLTWAESLLSTVTGFTIEWALNSTFTTGLAVAAGPKVRAFGLTGLAGNTRYYIRIRADNASVSSGWITVPVTTPR